MRLKANRFYVKELLEPVFLNGKCVFEKRETMDIKKYCEQQKESLWNEHKRLVNPHPLPVDLSLNLYNLKKDMIDSIRNR